MSIKARMRVNERMICADGIEPATEGFSHPANPPVLLIMDALFVHALAAGGVLGIDRSADVRRYGRDIRSHVPGFPGCPIRCAEAPEGQWHRRTIELEND